jgi:glyoxylase-like metal-dependent hydrolase (beta-lactamase superfamily II)
LFPKARVCLSRVDFDYWIDTTMLPLGGFTATCILGARRNLLPYRDRINFVEEGQEILPGIVGIGSPGHSPGHFSYIVGSADDRYIFLGDVAHTSHLQLANPDWPFAYDFDTTQAVQTRKALLERAVIKDLTLIGYHFDFPGIGKIVRDGEAYRFVAKPD